MTQWGSHRKSVQGLGYWMFFPETHEALVWKKPALEQEHRGLSEPSLHGPGAVPPTVPAREPRRQALLWPLAACARTVCLPTREESSCSRGPVVGEC